MNIFNTESYSFLLGTIFFIGLILMSGLVMYVCFRYIKPKKNSLSKKSKSIQSIVGIFFGLCFVAGIWALFIEPYLIVVRNFELKGVDLPPMKIVVVADFHLRAGKSKNFVNRVVKKINDQEPDMVFIPGDFLTSHAERYAPALSSLETIKSPVYFVLGNHDYKINGKISNVRANYLRYWLKKAELVELQNNSIFLHDKNISVVGVEDNYLGFDDLDIALRNIKDESYILLAHSPDIVDELQIRQSPNNQSKPSLIISGHTHCGQIRIPFLGAIPGLIPTHNGRKLDKHWYSEKNLFVTCGLGESGAAIRFNNPPEIAVLNIKKH